MSAVERLRCALTHRGVEESREQIGQLTFHVRWTCLDCGRVLNRNQAARRRRVECPHCGVVLRSRWVYWRHLVRMSPGGL